MSIPISGILLDPYGNVARFADIKFVTVQGALDVIESSSAVFRTDENGAYSIDVQFGRFAVLMRFNGNNGAYEKIQTISVNSDTIATTLGELLEYTEPLTPGEILIVQQLVQQATDAKNDAEAAALAALISEQNAAAHAAAALASENAAANSVALLAPVPLNGGVWAAGQTFTAYNQYMIFNGEAYSPRQETALPYVVGATPDLGFVYQIKLNSLQALSGLTEPSDLDGFYRRATTVTQIESGDFSVDDRLEITDRANAKAKIVNLVPYVVDGYGVLDAGLNKACIIEYDRLINPLWFGADNSGSTPTLGPCQAAVDYLAVSGGEVEFAPGRYLLEDTLVSKTGVKLSGSVPIGDLLGTSTINTTLVWGGSLDDVVVDRAQIDDTSAWTTVDCDVTFASAADGYLVSYLAATQYFYKTGLNFVAGKEYAIRFTAKSNTGADESCSAYVNTVLGGGGAEVFNFTMTGEWEEHIFFFDAPINATNFQIFTQMTSGSYNIKDIYVTEFKAIVKEPNVQFMEFSGISLVGDWVVDSSSAVAGVHIESYDGFQNSRRGKYSRFAIYGCFMGVAHSPIVQDSGNVDGYDFTGYDIRGCHTCFYNNSRFIAYTNYSSGNMRYYRTGLNNARATNITLSAVVGAAWTEDALSDPASFLRTTDTSGVTKVTGCQAEHSSLDKTRQDQKFLVCRSPIGATNLNTTLIESCYIQVPVDIYNKQDHITFESSSISHPVTFKAGSEGSICHVKSCREYTDGEFIVESTANSSATIIAKQMVSRPTINFQWNPSPIANGASESISNSLPGAITGDFILNSFQGDLLGCTLYSYVSATDTVVTVVTNNTGASVDLPTNSFYLKLISNDLKSGYS